MTAYDELIEYLDDDEEISCLIFGGWGGYSDDHLGRIPPDKIGVIMSLEEAKPYMQTWEFWGGYGAPECYAMYAWTNKRVIFVSEYDGSTQLNSVPNRPIKTIPGLI